MIIYAALGHGRNDEKTGSTLGTLVCATTRESPPRPSVLHGHFESVTQKVDRTVRQPSGAEKHHDFAVPVDEGPLFPDSQEWCSHNETLFTLL